VLDTTNDVDVLMNTDEVGVCQVRTESQFKGNLQNIRKCRVQLSGTDVYQIRVVFTKEFKMLQILVTFATIQFRILNRSFSYTRQLGLQFYVFQS
jgi:hypothetical protein